MPLTGESDISAAAEGDVESGARAPSSAAGFVRRSPAYVGAAAGVLTAVLTDVLTVGEKEMSFPLLCTWGDTVYQPRGGHSWAPDTCTSACRLAIPESQPARWRGTWDTAQANLPPKRPASVVTRPEAHSSQASSENGRRKANPSEGLP